MVLGFFFIIVEQFACDLHKELVIFSFNAFIVQNVFINSYMIHIIIYNEWEFN